MPCYVTGSETGDLRLSVEEARERAQTATRAACEMSAIIDNANLRPVLSDAVRDWVEQHARTDARQPAFSAAVSSTVNEMRAFTERLRNDGYPTALLERVTVRMQQFEALVVGAREALLAQCCHVSGTHDPRHYKEQRYVCELQRSAAAERARAALGMPKFDAREAYPKENCGWCRND